MFQVLEPFSGRIGLPFDDVEDIFYALENLRRLRIEFGTLDDVLVRIIAGVEADVSEWLKENKERLLQAVSEYGDDHPVAITYKAQRLAYLHERIFRDAEIITDLRPIFDAPGKNVREVIIAQTLVVSMVVSGRTERITLAMDAGDLVKLRAACDRAFEKAKSLNAAMDSSDLKWKVQILRGQEDGTS